MSRYRSHPPGSPEHWWLFFRVSLDQAGIRRMNDQQWSMALAANRRNKPITEAAKIARLIHDVIFAMTPEGRTVLMPLMQLRPKGQQ